MLPTVAVLPEQRPDNLIVDGPLQALRGPVYAVLVKFPGHFEARRYRCRPVIATGCPFAEIVRLHIRLLLTIVVAAPLPVDLVSHV